MRNMIPSFGRPVTVAKGRGFSKSYHSVKIVCSELKAYLMFRNVFRINETEEQARPRAAVRSGHTARHTDPTGQHRAQLQARGVPHEEIAKMDGELTESGALVHCFAEFTLLPKLLDAQRRNPNSPRAWMRVLDASGYNQSHIDNADMPPDPDTTSLMFNDAFRFCERIALTGRDGRLTENGTALADLSAVAFDELAGWKGIGL